MTSTRILARILAGTALAATLTAPATATATAEEYRAAAGGTCAFFYNREPYLLHKAVVVGGYAQCYGEPVSVTLRLALYHKWPGRAAERWSPVSATGIPNPKLNIATMVLECIPGLWQGQVTIEATWPSGMDTATAETKWTNIEC